MTHKGLRCCRAAQPQRRAGGLPHPPRASRVWRWSTAAGDAEAALNGLRELQEEYQDWHSNLPEFAQDTALAQKLEAMGGIWTLKASFNGLANFQKVELPLGPPALPTALNMKTISNHHRGSTPGRERPGRQLPGPPLDPRLGPRHHRASGILLRGAPHGHET